jgi:hypothetical protein
LEKRSWLRRERTASRPGARLGQLEQGRSPLQAVVGFTETLISQTLRDQRSTAMRTTGNGLYRP